MANLERIRGHVVAPQIWIDVVVWLKDISAENKILVRHRNYS